MGSPVPPDESFSSSNVYFRSVWVEIISSFALFLVGSVIFTVYCYNNAGGGTLFIQAGVFGVVACMGCLVLSINCFLKGHSTPIGIPLILLAWLISDWLLGVFTRNALITSCSSPKCIETKIVPLLDSAANILLQQVPFCIIIFLLLTAMENHERGRYLLKHFRWIRWMMLGYAVYILFNFSLVASMLGICVAYVGIVAFFERDETLRINERNGVHVPWEFIVSQ